MNLHLFSAPGREHDLRHILDASRTYLEGRQDPLVAYLPAGSLSNRWQELTEKAFRALGRVATISTEFQTQAEMEAVLRDAALVYIPGGNTYLLNHRLHLSGLLEYLRRKVSTGLPLLAFSAGTVLCGPNILTSNDLNMVDTPHYKGLAVTPFNFNVHYPDDPLSQAVRDEWLRDYHAFHDNPVLLLTEDAHVQVDGKKTTLVCGDAWILRPNQEKQKLEPGMPIQVNENIRGTEFN